VDPLAYEGAAESTSHDVRCRVLFNLCCYRCQASVTPCSDLETGARRDGERAVGQYLELLREGGARVFHDVTADGFNIDHVIVSPHGIFAIETKTWSKPKDGDPHIQFDGQHLRAGKLDPERDPIRQATAQAGWLQRLIAESTGKTFSVTPVVVFPGWFVEPSATAEARKQGVWLLNPRALPSFIRQESESVQLEDLKLVAFHLSRYIRTTTA
jgi:hypothetical protein